MRVCNTDDVVAHACVAADNFLTVYFGVSYPNWVNSGSTLKAQLYLAIVAQALVVKADISTRRARNSFGIITWQHNEIWSSETPSSISFKPFTSFALICTLAKRRQEGLLSYPGL